MNTGSYSIRRKTVMVIGHSMLVLFGLICLSSWLIVLHGFSRLERSISERNVQRAQEALQEKFNTMTIKLGDWARWDDCYAFVEDSNPEFVRSNLGLSAVETLQMDMMWFLNAGRETVYVYNSRDPQNRVHHVPESFQVFSKTANALVTHASPDSAVSGIVLLPEGPIIVASRPIVKSDNSGPIRGSLLFIQYFNQEVTRRFSEMLKAEFSVEPFEGSTVAGEFARLPGKSIYLSPISSKHIAGYFVQNDIFGKPALIVKVKMPRDIYHYGIKTLIYFILALFIVGLLFGAIVYLPLEKEIGARRWMEEQISTLLNNLEEGYLTLDSAGRILPGYSKTAAAFFGNDLAGKNLVDILQIPEDERAEVAEWLGLIFEGYLPFNDARSLGPNIFTGTGKYIQLSYRPVYTAGHLSHLILVASDKTKEQELLRKAEQEKERVHMILKIMADRSGFSDFLEVIREDIRTVNDILYRTTFDRSDYELVYRIVHTIKGNASLYSLSGIVKACHNLENWLFEVKRQNAIGQEIAPKIKCYLSVISKSIEETIAETEQLTGESFAEEHLLRKIVVSQQTIDQIERQLLDNLGADSPVYHNFINQLLLEPFLQPLKKYEALVRSIAERQNKQVLPIKWVGEDVKVRLKYYKNLGNVLIHAFRNVIDHGIETCDERLVLGKPVEGMIAVEVALVKNENKDFVRFTMVDDGRGIDPEQIRELVVKRGLATEEEVAILTDYEIIQFVFKSGFSTRKDVTEISGRGIGTDAIQFEVIKLAGQIWVESTKGAGTKMLLEVPYYT